MPLYGGIDPHANNSVVVVLGEQDQVIYQQRLSNHLLTILEQCTPYHADIYIGKTRLIDNALLHVGH
jgi:hypothetical protein